MENRTDPIQMLNDEETYHAPAMPAHKTMRQLKSENHGFITNDADLAAIINLNRFQQILVRCGAGRFLCPAQDVKHFTDIVEKSECDYVRDISFPAVDLGGKE
jgi:hypothetical protein